MLDGSKIDHLKEPMRTYGQQLLAEMERLQATGITDDEKLWETAAANLGNDDGRYDRFYVCLQCSCLYHGDYSSNSDPDRDFCGMECELNWVEAHPNSLTESATVFGLEPGTYFVQAIRLVEGVGFPPGNGQTIGAETC